MRYIYIKELEKREEIPWFNRIPKWLREWIWKIIKRSNIILIQPIEENKILWLIPNIQKENSHKKIRNKLEKENKQTLQIILDKKIKPYQEYMKGYKIIEGKKIFFEAIESILEKILKENPIALQDIYILTNHYQEQNINLIKKLTTKVKSMNIITKEVEKYKRLEEVIQEQGMAICTSNNKRKSLKRAKIIINLDFSKDELKEYTIWRSAIIINIPQDKMTNLKGFEGIVIQDIAIELEKQVKEWIKQNRLENSFRQLEIVESLKEEKGQRERIQVTHLYGNNGQISEKEIENWQKNIDKCNKLD